VRSAEHARIVELRSIFGEPTGGGAIGIGDDCARFESTLPVVVSVDASVEGVHFRRAWMSLAEIGYRATMAALSDLAAMGAAPLGVLGSLVLPPALLDAELYELARGQRAAAEEAGTFVMGGNLARGSELSITTTVFGAAARAVPRGGARQGDGVFVCGRLGAAAAGLEAFLRDRRDVGAEWEAARRAFVRPRALLGEGQRAAALGATAMIDVSDGLAADGRHLAEASGVRLVLSRDALEPFVATLPRLDGFDALAAVLSGGEDYALLFTLPAGVLPTALDARWVGTVDAGTPGVWLESSAGRTELRGGFDHFGASG
jgi:thiamine-monophosphate kinase